MALGKISDRNFSTTATFSEGTWEETLPVANLAQMSRWMERPARCSTDPAASKFTLTYERTRGINLIALLFHTLSLGALYRLTIAGRDGNLATPQVKVGDMVLFGKYGGQTVKLDDEEYLVLREEDVFGVIEGTAEARLKAA